MLTLELTAFPSRARYWLGRLGVPALVGGNQARQEEEETNMGGDGERVIVKWLKRIRAGYETDDAGSAKKHSLLARVLCNDDIN